MEKPVVDVESLVVRVVITYNPVTTEYDIKGVDENVIVAWGMLEYALSRIRRTMAAHDMREQLENASRISLPGGPLA